MSPLVFDTLYFANQLKSVGVPTQQAEVQAELMADFAKEQTVQFDIREAVLVTKMDLKLATTDLHHEIHNEITKLRSEVRMDMKDLEYRLTIKLGSLFVIGFGALAALLKL